MLTANPVKWFAPTDGGRASWFALLVEKQSMLDSSSATFYQALDNGYTDIMARSSDQRHPVDIIRASSDIP